MYYFSGLLRCGKCGEKLQGKSAYSKNKIRHYYYSHKSTCTKGRINRIDAELVHSIVFDWLEELVTDGEYYKQLQEDGNQRLEDEISGVQEELHRLETEKTEIADRIETRIQELVKTDSYIVRTSIEQSIEKLEAKRLDETEIKTALSNIRLKEPISAVFASSPPFGPASNILLYSQDRKYSRISSNLNSSNHAHLRITYIVFAFSLANCYIHLWKEDLMSYKVSAVIEKDEHGYYAYCPELEGCHTQGDTLEDVMENIKEAIELYLETLSEDERSIYLSKEILTTFLEVNLA